MTPALGPLGRVVEAQDDYVNVAGVNAAGSANALVMLRRVAFADEKAGRRLLLGWAERTNLGQDRALVAAVAGRRARLICALRGRGLVCVRLRVSPMWRLAVGLGDRANPHEIGMALHGTYGWPVIPGSTLKGLTHAWAVETEQDPDVVESLFGLPRQRPARDSLGTAGEHAELDDAVTPAAAASPERARPAARRGTVRFLDAYPAARPVTVVRDIVTPHVQPYYGDQLRSIAGTAEDGRFEPPAEHHNPVPSYFLSVAGGSYHLDVVSDAPGSAETAARWCAAACDDLGVGAKTSAGYGYLEVGREDAG